jgi:hypothetical protein
MRGICTECGEFVESRDAFDRCRVCVKQLTTRS